MKQGWRGRWWCSVVVAAAACRSAAVPEELYYRLPVPPAAAAAAVRGGVLRVQDLQLGTSIDADWLLRQDGVCVQPRPLARWVAPLDRLVTDALLLGLSRARVCELVKGAADPGHETWSLRGRILEFGEVLAGPQAVARVGLELWLEVDDRVLFHDEFVAAVPVADAATPAAVHAMGEGLQQIVRAVVERMQAQDLFAAAARARAAADGTPAGPGR
jgi:uncharacterized lipoprotein YmbA